MKNAATRAARFAAVLVALCFLGGYVLYAMGYLRWPTRSPEVSTRPALPAPPGAAPQSSPTEPIGYANYGEPIQTFSLNELKDPAVPLVITSKVINQPIFTVKQGEPPPFDPPQIPQEFGATPATAPQPPRLTLDQTALEPTRYSVRRKDIDAATAGTMTGDDLLLADQWPAHLPALETQTSPLGLDPVGDLIHLNRIVLPSVQFQEATVEECLEYLRQQSIRGADRLQFIFLYDHPEAAANPAPESKIPPASEGGGIGLEAFGRSEPPVPADPQPRVTLKLTNAPLGVVLLRIADFGKVKVRLVSRDVYLVRRMDIDPALAGKREGNELILHPTWPASLPDLDSREPDDAVTPLPYTSKSISRPIFEIERRRRNDPGHSLVRLNTINLPSVAFQEATVAECQEYLRQQMLRLDRAGTSDGMEITLLPDPSAPVDTSNIGSKRITLRLSNVTLGPVWKYVSEMVGMKIALTPENKPAPPEKKETPPVQQQQVVPQQ